MHNLQRSMRTFPQFAVIGVIAFAIHKASSIIHCPAAPPPSSSGPDDDGSTVPENLLQKFTYPGAFVTTKSVGFNPYALVDPYRQSALSHEYILVGPGFTHRNAFSNRLQSKGEAVEEIEMLMYDASEHDALFRWTLQPDLVSQNLGKEFTWSNVNATGMLPSLTIVNTTFTTTFQFSVRPDDSVAYYLTYPNLFRSRETVPPLDVIIEFPANTRTLRSFKTLIDYQTFGLLRWKLTPADPVLWTDLKKDYEYNTALAISDECNAGDITLPLCVYQQRLQRLENPCIKDMFLLYTIRGLKGKAGEHEKYTGVNKLFILIPMVYDFLKYKGWFDLTDAYCSRPKEYEECGEPTDVVLTNDHLLIMTDKGLWVSKSLNASNANVSLPYKLKPLLKFTPIDPCAEFTHFNCSTVRAPTLFRQTVKSQRLFYNPICHLFQYPDYLDVVILVYTHVSQSPDMSEERDVFTVLYAAKPYLSWKTLFFARHEYMTSKGPLAIRKILGIFFNHHRRHFDLSLLLVDKHGTVKTFRFILPEPVEAHFKGYQELSGLLGNGFLEYEFPPTFHMTHFTVNPEVMDIFFLGDQIWIAEAASPFIYLSVALVKDIYENPSFVESCSFNHPDRSFVCVEKTHNEIITGRVGVVYSPTIAKFDEIPEFVNTVLTNMWPIGYRQLIAMFGHFVASYSGKVMLWYIHDHNELVAHQARVLSQNGTKDDCGKNFRSEPVWCFICYKIKELIQEKGCTHEELPNYEPRFRMLSFDPISFKARDSYIHGPLVPFIIDGDKVIIFEADIPQLEGYKPDRVYLNDLNEGDIIYCQQESSVAAWDKDDCPPLVSKKPPPNCELFIRHIKHLKRQQEHAFLPGFRSAIFATIIEAFPLHPVPTYLVVLVLPNSNQAVIQLDSSLYEPGYDYVFRYGHIGHTLYIPEKFSVLLVGFPMKATTGGGTIHNMTRMTGIITRYYRQGAVVQVAPFKSFLVDFGTHEFCNFHVKGISLFNIKDPNSTELVIGEYERRRNKTNLERWAEAAAAGRPLKPPTYHELEDELLIINNPEIHVSGTAKLKLDRSQFTPPITPKLQCDQTNRWNLADGGCHLRLDLVPNPVIKQNGGRISLDKHDFISFSVKLRALSPLGKSLTHRPLISISNTNPDVLHVEKEEKFGSDPQVMHITLSPTGVKKGVAVITVRPVIVSTKCPFADGSFTLIVQVHRAPGRRLHVNYPIPVCKPKLELDDGYERPWKIDLPTCVTREELLTKRNIRRPDTPYGQIFFTTLPENYRPPSLRGAEIPLSRNVYNVNPAAPNYKDWYRISKETGVLYQCFGRTTRRQCDCFQNDELSDDVKFTDCKKRVYTVRRGFKVDISVEYDRVMRDVDQNSKFFIPKTNWSMYVEEVNNRVEFTLTSTGSLYLSTVNNQSYLNEGRTYFDTKTLGVTLHGTGLFHFKVGLGSFESFDEVTGYFMLFCDDTELNHVQLVVIMLLTISICMVFVFCGFLVVRNRLSSQLPYQTKVKNKIKLE